MPTPNCIRCSKSIGLDTATYWNYNGPIRCIACGFKIQMTFSRGELLAAMPLLDEKYLITTAHHIPAQPLGDYQEATTSLSAQAWKSCAVMARRAIQGALLIKGIADAPPRRMIDDAHHKQKLLTEKQYRLATTVTFFGGKGAHPEDTEINGVGEIEASTGLWVTKELLLALFP
jgi:DNA-directed RNA polymerase subunit RPC12/RpoP